MAEFKSKDPLDERGIILEIVQEVSRKFLIEFKGGEQERVIFHGTWMEKVTLPDARQEAIQGVELLTYLLRPHYNDPKTESLKMWDKDKEVEKKKKELLDKQEKGELEGEDYTKEKLLLMRDWFGELIMLLNSIKYLGRKKAF